MRWALTAVVLFLLLERRGILPFLWGREGGQVTWASKSLLSSCPSFCLTPSGKIWEGLLKGV